MRPPLSTWFCPCAQANATLAGDKTGGVAIIFSIITCITLSLITTRQYTVRWPQFVCIVRAPTSESLHLKFVSLVCRYIFRISIGQGGLSRSLSKGQIQRHKKYVNERNYVNNPHSRVACCLLPKGEIVLFAFDQIDQCNLEMTRPNRTNEPV